MKETTSDDQKPGIFSQLKDLTSTALQAKIYKAKADLTEEAQRKMSKDDGDVFHAKSLLSDPSYQVYAQGWQEKPTRLQNGHLKQMASKSSIVSAIILTRQNQVSTFSKLAPTGKNKGWRITIKNERRLIADIKKQLVGKLEKADAVLGGKAKNDSEENKHWELEREAKRILKEEHLEAQQIVEDYIADGGLMEGRPFLSKKWGFDAILRAWVRDSLTYDLYATEIVTTEAGTPHHFSPVDAGTVKFAAPSLSHIPMDNAQSQVELEILYPEKEAKEVRDSKILELDPQKVDDGDYRYVQVVRGRVERAFTEDELKIGIRNPTTDIYQNGYGVAEMELAVSLITGHLNAEHYNQSYFTQGFSAKGILHIKSNINRRKLETIRMQWQHMLKGSRNSFQTPIFAGVDEVDWIKLDQKHDDIGFEGWMRYVIKMICAIYQIDPQEIGIGFKEEGGKGGGMSGDNTTEKVKQSQEKGLFPLLRHFQAYINNHIITPFDDRFCLEFVGMTTETEEERIKRLEKLSTFAMDINEVRAELDLEAIPGADGVVQSTEYLQWYMIEKQGLIPSGSIDPTQVAEKDTSKKGEDSPKKVEKALPLKIEYYTSGSE